MARRFSPSTSPLVPSTARSEIRRCVPHRSFLLTLGYEKKSKDHQHLGRCVQLQTEFATEGF